MKKAIFTICCLVFLSACEGEIPLPPEENSPDDVVEDPGEMDGEDLTGLGLQLPENFRISEFVDGLSGARVIAGPDALGNYWVSRTSEGIISNVEIGEGGEVKNVEDIFVGLDRPHGIAIDPDGLTMYLAEENKVSKVRLYTEDQLATLVELPEGGRHFTRTLIYGPDDRLYVSVGSSCDTCVEEDERLAAIYVMDTDGSNFEQFASGLRNAVFMDVDPVTGEIWATEMGRDFLGDDLPPDEVNIIQEGKDYGWPYCYGQQVRDLEFRAGEMMDYCEGTEAAWVELQAHSAPLGLAFIPEEGWPEEMWLDLVVAYHGSWNRSEATGYKIIQIELDQDQRKATGRKDFISGWLDDSGAKLGRPVDISVMPGGLMFITDDKRGVIYKVEYLGQN